MDKELFITNINRIKALYNKIDQLHDTTNGVVNLFEIKEIFEVIDGLVELLQIEMYDIGDDISYFIFELDFGAEYEKGSVVDENGNYIDFSTTEKLYDFLTNRRITMAFEQDEEIRSTPVNQEIVMSIWLVIVVNRMSNN